MIIDITQDTKCKFLCLNESMGFLMSILLGVRRPINNSNIQIVTNIICPLLKNKAVFKQSILKESLIKLMTFDEKYLNAILSYLLKSWPIRFPEIIIVYLDIIENLFTNKDTKNEDNIESSRKKRGSLREILDSTLVDTPIMIQILKKIQTCFYDLNFLIADRSLVYFKNETFIIEIYKHKLENTFLNKLIGNIKEHWSQEIKIISKIVIEKLIKRDKNLKDLLTDEDMTTINNFQYEIEETEDIWDIQFNLKGD